MSTIINKRQIIVGIFIIVGIAILIATIFTLGGQKKTFVKSIKINAVFDNVGGLIKGGNIWFSGVKIGTVKSIGFYGDSKVIVSMSIDKTVQPHIHKDAFAKIGSDGLIGNKIIIIYNSDTTKPSVDPNDFLQVESVLSTDDMLATLQKNNKNLLEITQNFKSISKKIDSGQGLIASLLNDPKMSMKFKNTLDDLGATAANFKTVSSNSKTVIANLQNVTGKINQPGNSIHDIVEDTVLYANLRATFSQLEKTFTELHQFASNLRTTSDKLNQKNNVAGVILNDSSTANSIRVILKKLESSSQKLDEDLEAIQHNFLLRGFFRKKEKAAKQ
jgi:phospholipid/cholesterol/gamma-HCH transport system substrate-binding protein